MNDRESVMLLLENLTTMAGFLFEACVDSLHSALEAQRGGAGRLELCADLALGGTTPSYGLMKQVKEQVQVPVHVLIRPRAGHFVYSTTELEVMLEDIAMVGRLGLQGVAIGALTPHKEIDDKAMRTLLDRCEQFNLCVTFHRAFDLVSEPVQALEYLANLGTVSRILTSGQQPSAVAGIELLRALIAKAAGRIRILPGCGVTDQNAAYLVEQTGASELHGSLRTVLGGNYSVLPGDEEQVVWACDAVKLHKIVSSCSAALLEHRRKHTLEF